MKKSMILGLVLLLGLSLGSFAVSDTATQNVTITFSEIAVLDVSSNPGTFTIVAPAVAGNLPANQMDDTTWLSWTCNLDTGSTRKITGALDSLFSGIDLSASIAETDTTGTGTYLGNLLLTAIAVDHVTGLTNENVSGQAITFTAVVSAMVGTYTDTIIVLTWTITEDL